MPVYLMHAYKMPDDAPLRLQLDDHWFSLPTGEPTEILTDDYGKQVSNPEFYAMKLIETYGANYGIIEVPSVKTRSGVQIDADAGYVRAQQQLAAVEDMMVVNWVRVQLEERVKEGKPVMPPVGRVEQIIRERNIDLKAKYGLAPVGFDFVPKGQAQTVTMVPDEATLKANAAMQAELIELKLRVAELTQTPAAVVAPSDITAMALASLLGIDSADLKAKMAELTAAAPKSEPNIKAKATK